MWRFVWTISGRPPRSRADPNAVYSPGGVSGYAVWYGHACCAGSRHAKLAGGGLERSAGSRLELTQLRRPAGETKRLALFTEGLREFEVVGEDKKAFAVTLLRGVGLLGKEDLLLRPGRPSGIKLPVPDSQVRGALSCRFSLFSFSGTPENAGVAQQAKSWLTPVQCYNKIPWDAMKLNRAPFTTPESYSLLALSPTGCVLSALKKAEDRDELFFVCLTRQRPAHVMRRYL